MQGCHKLGFYPSSRIFNTCQSYSDGFVGVYGFLGLGANVYPRRTRAYLNTYVRTYVGPREYANHVNYHVYLHVRTRVYYKRAGESHGHWQQLFFGIIHLPHAIYCPIIKIVRTILS